ncbi:MAG: leucyl aminopeptidase [archaeon]
MKARIAQGPLDEAAVDMIIAGMFEGDHAPPEVANIADPVADELGLAIKNEEFKGKKDSIIVIDTKGACKPRKVAIVGLGKSDDHSLDNVRRAAHTGRKAADKLRLKTVGFAYSTLHHEPSTPFLNGLAMGEGASLGQYLYEKFKAEKKDAPTVATITLFTAEKKALEGAEKGLVVAESVKWCRDMVNEPANNATPTFLAEQAKRIGKETGIKVTVYDRKGAEKLGLASFLTVAKGSDEEPRFIVMELNPKKEGGTALVGKGITFDAGGYDIKPAQWMDYMKSDMGGAAAVMATMMNAALLGYPDRLLGIVASCENMINGKAMRPGDVVTGLSGVSIEIINTDAEGRLILADAVAYAESLKPARIIDVATLTGAAISTLGYIMTPILGTDRETIEALKKTGDVCHERVWEMPIDDEFRKEIESDIADIRNISKGKGFEAGVTAGGAFINAHIKDTPHTHIDIGNTSWFPEQKSYVPKNATGIPVRLLTYHLMGWG